MVIKILINDWSLFSFSLYASFPNMKILIPTEILVVQFYENFRNIIDIGENIGKSYGSYGHMLQNIFSTS